MLSNRLGQDFSSYALDDPIPDLALPDTSHGFARALLGRAKRERMTLRDLYNLTVAARGHMVLCGSPLTIVNALQRWFEEGAADGFNIMPAHFPGAFDEFVDLVVPELQRRRLFRSDYAGATLRDHLGLTRPEPRRRTGQPISAK
jgi:alkanesulfonate monooxygenase SsuD/methylene tetrahydromethanopterin reductase-like flavin-dependent oxidoreductase (luciferase family)